ncbi:MAG: type II toxin-antitoxin system HipA family toxin YjjJ [Gammaproteobacteria bacterium]|nr:type II toxin-antitoxin system HipA family toxin YjjJ [Gammaproteobacteria bacterium]MBU1506091.1 type II toxin-antitoxin system HipA family toxin YjjJ [Gammaproteobacteria bacterium]MBU2119720.1 type II toxin-antitoxin system HipA family toxin YjjJ [Gammaproteobacteria bacterium]MBU2170292.1 type II toxin-antitoxin system HipA family toxin YjjJ [Gammaproteobacteria bacterium]MBU2202907.1 type II toxin-antitoxin system HipA family toxin YjjJ [Gammaproteobacteria bacterium]
MLSTHELTPKALQALRRQGGVLTSAELQELLGVSQPTVSRALAPLIHAGQVQKVGAARSQRYVLPRNVPGVGSEVRLMRIDTRGRPSPFARMVPLEGGAFWVDEADGVSARHDGLPWFLDDMRPQGFMGRTFAHAHPELQLGHDPGHWSDDDVLRAMTLYGDDLPGNLVMGEAAFQRFHTLPTRASRVASAADYPQLAEQAMRGTHPGSSAGGEQPKFCTITAGRHVIVKFSPAGDAPADQRMRDLLVCEHLALHTLAQAGLPAAPTQLFMGAGRVFLESERFDRTPLSGDAPLGGRLGMVSLQVYNAEYVGEIDNWAATANRMAARNLLTQSDARTLRLLEAYGQLIANTDRHYGNISLVLEDDDWALSPTYDMLPMLYAPVGGELVPRDFASRPQQPTAATLGEWEEARDLALAFWQAAAGDKRVSADFRSIAAENARHVGG